MNLLYSICCHLGFTAIHEVNDEMFNQSSGSLVFFSFEANWWKLVGQEISSFQVDSGFLVLISLYQFDNHQNMIFFLGSKFIIMQIIDHSHSFQVDLIEEIKYHNSIHLSACLLPKGWFPSFLYEFCCNWEITKQEWLHNLW